MVTRVLMTPTRTRTRTRFLALKTHHHPWIMLFTLLVFQNCSLFSFTITSVNALGCECTGDEYFVSGVSLGSRCAEWGDKNAICADQTTVTDECCKPWCWVSKTNCPSARYNKAADKYFSHVAPHASYEKYLSACLLYLAEGQSVCDTQHHGLQHSSVTVV